VGRMSDRTALLASYCTGTMIWLSPAGGHHGPDNAEASHRPRPRGRVPGTESAEDRPHLALLNVVIVLTSFPVLVFAGGPEAVAPALAIMAGISLLIWTVTFALYFFLTLPRLFRTPVSSRKPLDPPHPAQEAGVADRWLDGPV
jgi:hypothetical protein